MVPGTLRGPTLEGPGMLTGAAAPWAGVAELPAATAEGLAGAPGLLAGVPALRAGEPLSARPGRAAGAASASMRATSSRLMMTVAPGSAARSVPSAGTGLL